MTEPGLTLEDITTAVIGLSEVVGNLESVVRGLNVNCELVSKRTGILEKHREETGTEVKRLSGAMDKMNDICGILLEAIETKGKESAE